MILNSKDAEYNFHQTQLINKKKKKEKNYSVKTIPQCSGQLCTVSAFTCSSAKLPYAGKAK